MDEPNVKETKTDENQEEFFESLTFRDDKEKTKRSLIFFAFVVAKEKINDVKESLSK